MSDDFGANLLTIIDENGQESVLEVVDFIDVGGKSYLVALPGEMDENDPDYGLILLRTVMDENGEEVYESIDDDSELDAVYNEAMRVIFSDDEEEDGITQ